MACLGGRSLDDSRRIHAKVVWSDTIVNGGNIRNLTLPMPEALDGYYEDIVTYAIPLERQPEDTSLKPKVTFGNLKSAVIKDESKAVNRDEKGVFRSSYPCWIQYEYAEPVTCSNVEIILGGNNYQAHRLKVLASEDGRTFKTVKQLVPARQMAEYGFPVHSCYPSCYRPLLPF